MVRVIAFRRPTRSHFGDRLDRIQAIERLTDDGDANRGASRDASHRDGRASARWRPRGCERRCGFRPGPPRCPPRPEPRPQAMRHRPRSPKQVSSLCILQANASCDAGDTSAVAANRSTAWEKHPPPTAFDHRMPQSSGMVMSTLNIHVRFAILEYG